MMDDRMAYSTAQAEIAASVFDERELVQKQMEIMAAVIADSMAIGTGKRVFAAEVKALFLQLAREHCWLERQRNVGQ